MSSPLAARTVEIDDPGDLLAVLPRPDALVWMRGADALVSWGDAVRVPVPVGPDRFARAQEALREAFGLIDHCGQGPVPGCGPVAFASFTFRSAAGSTAIIPRVAVRRCAGRAWVTVVAQHGDEALSDPTAQVRAQAPPTPHDRVRYAGSSLTEVAWLGAVAEAVDQIRCGRYRKVVLARDRRVWTRQPLDPRLLARRLAERFPTCFVFAVDGLVGATPELLIRKDGEALESLVLAGSAARGADPDDDEALGAALRDSVKDASEHALALDSVRRELEACAADVRSDDEPWLLRLANVQHLATTVRARLAGSSVSALGLAGRLHPTAAVGGTPTPAALEAIARLEHMDRGRYAAPVGWVDARGDGEFGIALRCAEVSGSSARLFAGAGIVEGSLPEAELEETRLKLRAMQSALEHPA